jgi:hypothetical protein
VLLSQLGTYLGQGNYPQGFPRTDGQVPAYADQSRPANTLKSFYNAITRKEYERAYRYYQGAPTPDPRLAPPYQQWVQGYADTAATTLAYNPNYREDHAAGNIYAAVRAAIQAQHTDGRPHLFSGCYVLYRLNDGVSPNLYDVLWHIIGATVQEVPPSTPLDTILTQPCTP